MYTFRTFKAGPLKNKGAYQHYIPASNNTIPNRKSSNKIDIMQPRRCMAAFLRRIIESPDLPAFRTFQDCAIFKEN
jgi:hypothetical protein